MDAVPLLPCSWRRWPALAVVLGLCLSALAPASPAYAATIAVTTTTDELNADDDCSLREAIRAANTDTAVDACVKGSGADTITLPAGTYPIELPGPNEDAAATGDFDLTSDVTITGAGASAGSTIIQGQQDGSQEQDRVFDVHAAAMAVIANVTIRGVVINDPTVVDGAGIRNRGTLTLRTVIIRENRFDSDGDHSGGGIANSGTLTILDSSLEGNGGGTFTVGGGIVNSGTLTLTRTTVRDNSVGIFSFGGGILNGGQLTVIDSTVSGNGASAAGGIDNRGSMSITDSTVSGNHASGRITSNHDGGGIRNGGTLTLIRTAITENRAQGGGGGILNGGQLTVIDSTVSGNQSGGGGGGIANHGGPATLRDTTVSNNTARISDPFSESGGAAGGIFNEGPLTLNNVTIANNTAADNGPFLGSGGGLFSTEEAVTTVSNTVVAHNTASESPDCVGTLQSQGYNLIQAPAGCTLAGVTTGNLLTVDARLGPLADNGGPTATHALLAGSPALDAGNPATPGSSPSACVPTDQRGVPRPQDGDGNGSARCDIGAFELQGAVACPPGAGAIVAHRYTITRGSRTIEVRDLTGRVQPGDAITAVVTVAPGCTDSTIALAAYQAQTPAFDPRLEQVLHAQDTRVVGTGDQQLAVAVPDCYFQVDLVVGPVLERIGPPSDYYRQRQVDYATGGSSVCPAFAAPAIPRPLPEAEAGAHKLYLGGVAR